MSIKAIVFDYFGVICSDEYWNFVKEDKNMGGQFQQLARDVNLGTLSWPKFIEHVAEKTGKSVNEVAELYKTEQIHPELVAYAEELRRTYKTALLTNASHEFLQPIIEEAHLTQVFDEIVMSSQVGITKPDPRIFLLVLERLGVEPREAVFIDDIASNVDGAVAVGMQAIVYQDFQQMKRDLEALLYPV